MRPDGRYAYFTRAQGRRWKNECPLAKHPTCFSLLHRAPQSQKPSAPWPPLSSVPQCQICTCAAIPPPAAASPLDPAPAADARHPSLASAAGAWTTSSVCLLRSRTATVWTATAAHLLRSSMASLPHRVPRLQLSAAALTPTPSLAPA
jgi:hypothetical protein